MLYLNMYQAKAAPATKTITPPFGTCDQANYTKRRDDIIGVLKYSDTDDITTLLNTACYTDEQATPQRSELLSCPDEGCALYTVSLTRTTAAAPTCTPPAWSEIVNGTAPALNSTGAAITYAAPYQLYNATSQAVVAPTQYSVPVPASATGTMDGLYDTSMTEATPPSALLPLQDLDLASPSTIYLTAAPEVGNVNVTIKDYAPLWTFVTGSGTSELKTATLTAADGGVLIDSSGGSVASISIGSKATPATISTTFYYLGSSAKLSSDGGQCTIDFDGETATGQDCGCLTVNPNQTLLVAADTPC